jgi:hypothetical protein
MAAFLFLKGMTGALAPFSYLFLNNVTTKSYANQPTCVLFKFDSKVIHNFFKFALAED